MTTEDPRETNMGWCSMFPGDPSVKDPRNAAGVVINLAHRADGRGHAQGPLVALAATNMIVLGRRRGGEVGAESGTQAEVDGIERRIIMQ